MEASPLCQMTLHEIVTGLWLFDNSNVGWGRRARLVDLDGSANSFATSAT